LTVCPGGQRAAGRLPGRTGSRRSTSTTGRASHLGRSRTPTGCSRARASSSWPNWLPVSRPEATTGPGAWRRSTPHTGTKLLRLLRSVASLP